MQKHNGVATIVQPTKGKREDTLVDEQDFEYRGLLAASWDLLRGDTSNWEDKFFYRDIINQYGQPVLDVGCGTGRLLLDYLREGLDVDGVDNSPDMLSICRSKSMELGLKPNLYEQWMEALILPRKYHTILVPSCSFQLVTDSDKATQAMERFYQHLEPGGVLVMPFMIFWQEGNPIRTDWKLIAEAPRPEDGAVVRRYFRASYEVENQLQHTEDRFEITHDGQVIASEHHQRSPATRWYTQTEAVHIYQVAGFKNIQVFRDFDPEPASESDTDFTILGVRQS